MSQRYIPALSGLRGLAALAVVASHTDMHSLAFGTYGVDCFFAISGFLIGGILLDTAGSPGWVGRFYLRRTLRIWPLFFAVLAITVLANPSPRPDGWMTWVFLENFRGLAHPHDPLVFGIFWTLAVEEQVYLLLPPVIRWTRRSRLPFVLVAVCFVAPLVRVHGWYAWRHGQAVECCWYIMTAGRLDSFAVGVLAAWVMRERPQWIPFLLQASVVIGSALAGVATLFNADLWMRPDNPTHVLFAPLAAYATERVLVGPRHRPIRA